MTNEWLPSGPSDISLVEQNPWWGGEKCIWRDDGVWYSLAGGDLYHNPDDRLVSSSWTQQATGLTDFAGPAGGAMVYDNHVDIPIKYQPSTGDGHPVLKILRLTNLSTSSYETSEPGPKPIVGGTGPPTTGSFWNSSRVHHMDMVHTGYGTPIYLVDGRKSGQAEYSIGGYLQSGQPRMLATTEIDSGSTPFTIGGSGAMDSVQITRGLDYYNRVDASNDEIYVPETGVYEVCVRLVVDPSDTITTPFDVPVRMYDGNNNVWGGGVHGDVRWGWPSDQDGYRKDANPRGDKPAVG